MAQKYKSKWTGPQVDEAVGNVSKKIDKDSLIGSNGITIKKTDSNIEISGVELVKKTIETNKVYGTDSTGGQALKPFADTPTPSALAAYNEVSNLKTSVPVEDLDCTNKKYVDDNYVPSLTKNPIVTSYGRVYAVDSSGKNNNSIVIDNYASGNSICIRYRNGRLKVATPIENDQAADKKYVDEAVATSSTTVDGTSIVKDADGKIQLNQEYIDYLDNQLYQPPAISVFTMLDAAGAALPTSNELGTTLSAAAFNHQETNTKNIQGDNVELHINNAVAATTSTAKKDVATKVTLTTAQSITSSTKFTLKGTNTKGAAFSRDYQVNFYRYAYTATTDATTAPTSGATQQAAVSTFASNGSTFNYTKGAYIYFYTDNTGKKVQTNVLGQWADVDTTDMGKVTLTQSNGATHEYTCYRIGPFIETGSAKYRV